MMDHPTPELIFLACSISETLNLTPLQHLSLYERGLRNTEFFSDTIVDSSGKLAVVTCYNGKLKFVVLKEGKYSSDFDVR